MEKQGDISAIEHTQDIKVVALQTYSQRQKTYKKQRKYSPYNIELTSDNSNNIEHLLSKIDNTIKPKNKKVNQQIKFFENTIPVETIGSAKKYVTNKIIQNGLTTERNQ